MLVYSIIIFTGACIMLGGYFIVEPNGSKVLLLFGNYKGTVKASGWH